MSEALEELIAEAQAIVHKTTCLAGEHIWQSRGGRACRYSGNKDCSQTAYQCVRCGDWDYGEVGGPAHTECEADCRNYEPPCRPGEALRERFL